MYTRKVIVKQGDYDLDNQGMEYVQTPEGNLVIEVKKEYDWETLRDLIGEIDNLSRLYEIVFAANLKVLMQAMDEIKVKYTKVFRTQ